MPTARLNTTLAILVDTVIGFGGMSACSNLRLDTERGDSAGFRIRAAIEASP